MWPKDRSSAHPTCNSRLWSGTPGIPKKTKKIRKIQYPIKKHNEGLYNKQALMQNEDQTWQCQAYRLKQQNTIWIVPICALELFPRDGLKWIYFVTFITTLRDSNICQLYILAIISQGTPAGIFTSFTNQASLAASPASCKVGFTSADFAETSHTHNQSHASLSFLLSIFSSVCSKWFKMMCGSNFSNPRSLLKEKVHSDLWEEQPNLMDGYCIHHTLLAQNPAVAWKWKRKNKKTSSNNNSQIHQTSG